MANNFSQNPFILDTVWTASTIPSALQSTTRSPDQFRKIVWIAPATTGDTLVITDINGNVILTATASAADLAVELWSEASGRMFTLKQGEWVLSQLSSGKLYMYK